MFLDLLTNSIGELAALSAASIWACTSVFDNRLGKQICPSLMTLLKGGTGIIFLSLTLLWQGEQLPSFSPINIGFLLLSGVIGISFGDTCYYQTLNYLGPRRTLLLQVLTSPFSALIAFIYLHETLSFMNWLGMAVTITGVGWVLGETPCELQTNRVTQFKTGAIYGLLGVMGQAVGAVLSRSALSHSSIHPLWSTLLRLIAGMIVLLIWHFLTRKKQTIPRKQHKHVWGFWIGTLALSAFFGTYLGGWLQQTAFKYTATGVAQALCATSPAFILPIGMWMGEKVSYRAVQGVLIAFVGIGLLLGHI